MGWAFNGRTVKSAVARSDYRYRGKRATRCASWASITVCLLAVVFPVLAYAKAESTRVTPTCEAVIADANKAYGGNKESKKSLQSIADHGDALAQALFANVLNNQSMEYFVQRQPQIPPPPASEIETYAGESARNGNSLGEYLYGFISLDKGKNGYFYAKADWGSAKALWNKQLVQQGDKYLEEGLAGLKTDSLGVCSSPYQSMLGYAYTYGIGTKQDLETAIQLYTKASSKGYLPAMGSLASIYAWKQGPYYDPSQAYRWAAQAAHLGYSPAITLLGDLYYNGVGVKKDAKKAFALYKQAASGGFPLAEYKTGLAYFDGHGTAVDRVKAFGWMTKAANSTQGYFGFGPAYLALNMMTIYMGLDHEPKMPSVLMNSARKKFLAAAMINPEVRKEFKQFEVRNGLPLINYSLPEQPKGTNPNDQ